MAIFDDDDYYSPDYLNFMLHELKSRNVSLVKLGAWPQFMGRWEGNSSAKGAELSGSMWYLNVTNSKAKMGYGFSYFFSRAAARAQVHIAKPDKFNWDGQWVAGLRSGGHRVAVVNSHPLLLAIKVQHGDNLSGPLATFLEPLRANVSQVKALLEPTLPLKLRDARPSDKAWGRKGGGRRARGLKRQRNKE